MSSFESVVFDGRAIWLPDQRTLVLADVHLGRTRSSRVDLPLGSHEDFLDRLELALDAHTPDRVVVAGDLVHDFDSVPLPVAETVADLVELVETRGADLVVTTGNHDTVLAATTAVDPVPEYRLDESTVVHHGHELPEAKASRVIIGHEHPAITIEGVRRPCFLDCPDQYQGRAVLVLPAFSRVAVGTTVNGADATDSMSPLLTDLGPCRPIVALDDGPLTFPPLAELRPHL